MQVCLIRFAKLLIIVRRSELPNMMVFKRRFGKSKMNKVSKNIKEPRAVLCMENKPFVCICVSLSFN